ncbi:SPOR domain-containing protein [Streptomyces sp. NPDC015350]|uniref:SPOR domain-containing protein n=1 Tax=Streptomyces sp. NPDC015350 TaxID=3364955 RepID=UPI0036F7D44A
MLHIVNRAPASGVRRARPHLAAAVVLAVGAPVLLTGAAQAHPVHTHASKASAEWSTRTPAPGVTVRSGVIRTAATHSWAVTIQVPSVLRLTTNDPDAPSVWSDVSNRAWAEATAETLRKEGHQPRVEEVKWPRYTDTPGGTMGYRVRVGSFTTQDAAKSTRSAINELGLHTTLSWTGYDSQTPADRQNVNVTMVDPKQFTGTVEATHNGNVADRETTSSVSRALGSLVGVNGGFFVMTSQDGVVGTMAGIGAYNGELESMAAGARTALIIDDGRRFRTTDLTSTVTAKADGATFRVEGINRVPGVVRNCGRPGSKPSPRPWQDVTCTQADDLVYFTPSFKTELPTGPGTQVVLDASGRVVSTGTRGGTVPAGGRVLQGITTTPRTG